MKCEMKSSVEECALRARSTHGVHHAIVEVNIVIGVVLGEVLVARVVPLVVDAVIGLTLGLIAHVVIVVFFEAIFNRIFLYGRYTLYSLFTLTLPYSFFSAMKVQLFPFLTFNSFVNCLAKGVPVCVNHQRRSSPVFLNMINIDARFQRVHFFRSWRQTPLTDLHLVSVSEIERPWAFAQMAHIQGTVIAQ